MTIRTNNSPIKSHLCSLLFYHKISNHTTHAKANFNCNFQGESEFWCRKMRTLHNVLDIDKNGVLSYDDFMVFADKFGQLGHLSAAEVADFRQVLTDTWTEQWGEISQYNLVSLPQYLTDMKHVVNDSSLRKKCHTFLPFIFRVRFLY